MNTAVQEQPKTELAERKDTPMQAIPTPEGVSPLVQLFASGQFSPDQINQMIDLQAKYDAIEAKKAFDDAMSRFRAEVSPVRRDREGHNKGQFYATLAAVVNTITEPLSNNGFNYSWRDAQDHEKKEITVTCVVTHSMGHSESTSLTSGYETSGNKNAIQAVASAKSYLNRYTLMGLLGLATEDDDGKAATDTPATPLIDAKQYSALMNIVNSLGSEYADKWDAHYLGKYGTHDILGIAIPAAEYDAVFAESNSRYLSKRFTSAIENSDALTIYSMSKECDQATWVRLFNSGEKKTKTKEAVRKLEASGGDMLTACAENLDGFHEQQDDAGAIEILEDLKDHNDHLMGFCKPETQEWCNQLWSNQ